MLKARFPTLPTRLLLACVFSLALAIGSSARAGLAAPLQAVPGHSLTIPAGDTGTIQVQAISLGPGSALGTGALPLAAQPLATDRVRTALFHGIDWGYTDSAPYQVALAVWWVQDSNWLSSDREAAERIGTAAVSSAGTPSWNPDGVSLLNLAQAGQVTISPVTLVPSAQNPSLGTGAFQVTNNSANSLTVYLPYGAVFGGPASRALVWATGTGGSVPQTTPTSAPQATDTPEPAAPTAAPTQPRKGGGQPPAPTAQPSGQTKGNPPPAPSDTPAPPPDTPTPLPPPTATTPPAPPAPAPVEESLPIEQEKSSGGTQDETQQPASPASPPASAPPDVKGEDESESAPAPTGAEGSENVAQPDNPTQEVQGSAPSGGASAVRPDAGVYGPPLPPGATSTPGDVFPEPVTTTFVPQAIDTSEPTTLAPNPQTTNEVPVPPAQSTNEVPLPVITNLPTTAPIPTPEAEPTKEPAVEDPVKEVPGSSDLGPATDGGTGGAPPVDSVPTPAPTPVPQPITVGPNDGNGTVDATSGGAASDGGGTTGEQAGGVPASGAGAPPQVNPATGGGRSDLPIWLGIASALMILGGWTLRRTARAATTPIPIPAEQ